jgi:hypothetical protein
MVFSARLITRQGEAHHLSFHERRAVAARDVRLQTDSQSGNGEQLPESVRMGQRLTGMSGNQASLPLAGSIFKFQQHGKSGAG